VSRLENVVEPLSGALFVGLAWQYGWGRHTLSSTTHARSSARARNIPARHLAAHAERTTPSRRGGPHPRRARPSQQLRWRTRADGRHAQVVMNLRCRFFLLRDYDGEALIARLYAVVMNGAREPAPRRGKHVFLDNRLQPLRHCEQENRRCEQGADRRPTAGGLSRAGCRQLIIRRCASSCSL